MDIIDCFVCLFLLSGAVFFNFFTVAMFRLMLGKSKGTYLPGEGKDAEIDEKTRHIENLMNYDPYKAGRDF